MSREALESRLAALQQALGVSVSALCVFNVPPGFVSISDKGVCNANCHRSLKQWNVLHAPVCLPAKSLQLDQHQ
jgi:hypothetical protein